MGWQAYAQCLHAYTTPDWQQACATDHDAGAALYALLDNVASAASAACATECASGQDWRCVGHVTWPTPVGPPGSTTTIIFEQVKDANTLAAIADAEVALCTPSNVSGSLGAPQCDPPFVSGMTNDTGYVEIKVPTAEPNSGTVVGSAWWTFISAPGDYPPFYYYSFFPLSQSVWTLSPNASPYVFTASDIAAFYASTLDVGAQTSGTGSVTAFVYDCQVHAAPGVQVTPDPAVLSSEDAGTIANGFGMGSENFGNVPVGTLTLTATPPGLGKAIGQFSFYVSASADTVVGLFPQP